MSEASVLVVAREAGSAAALAPVVSALAEDGTMRAEVVAWEKAAVVFAEEGIAVRSFPEDPAPDEIETLLESVGAIALLSGTSLRPELDGRFWAAAAAAGVPSVALLDHWKLYAARFSQARPFDTLPTVLAVMDDVAARELAALGCPPERIRVTGQPRFDGLPVDSLPALRAEARTELGIDADRRVVAFASEPRGRPYDDGTGYTQADALAGLRDAVDAVAPDALVLVKLHPLETDEPGLPGVTVLRDFPVRALAAAADVFCGITSIALLDAALLGVPTVSVRPGDGGDHFVDSHPGLIASATTADEIAAALASGFAAGRRVPEARPPAGAAARVCSLLGELASVGRMAG